MSSIYFADLSSDEMSRLRQFGVVEDSEGLSISDEERWEWLDPTGRAFPIAERVDILTLSTVSGLSEDEWQFCRIKFQGSNEYVYLIDALFCADSYVIGGMSSDNVNDAVNIFRKIISWEDSRIPGKIIIHAKSGISKNDISSAYKSLTHYEKYELLFIEEWEMCEISIIR